MANDIYYNEVRQLIAKEASGGTDPEDIIWAVVEASATVIDGVTGSSVAGLVCGGMQTLTDTIKHNQTEGLTPNPWFVFNGHDEAECPYTKKYLRNRGRKGIASGVISIGGALGSGVTQADVAGILQHGNAVGSTTAHLVKLHNMAKSYKQSRTLTGWFDLLIRMKVLKAGLRGTQLVGSCIPVTGVSIATGLAAAVGKLGIKLNYTNTCLITAADIHWRAYQEQAISGGLFRKTGKVGPASNMMYELFTRRGATRIFGKYDVDAIIKEPAGWMAVSDKLLLL